MGRSGSRGEEEVESERRRGREGLLDVAGGIGEEGRVRECV